MAFSSLSKSKSSSVEEFGKNKMKLNGGNWNGKRNTSDDPGLVKQ